MHTLHGKVDRIERERIRAIALARFYDYETLYAQYAWEFVSDEYWSDRVVLAVRALVTVWAKRFSSGELSSRQIFENEIKRIPAEKSG
jgi:hypothetical protein